MKNSGSIATPRARLVMVAAAGGLALVIGSATISQIDTVAAFTDSARAGGTFNLGDTIDIEASTEFSGEYSDHDSPDGALKFAPSVSLLPGETTYAGYYLRTTGISTAANVGMSPVTNVPESANGLWTHYVTYSARSTTVTGAATCDAAMFTGPATMNPVPLNASDPTDVAVDFGLAAESGSVEFVCFQFTLDANVIGDSSLNGQTASPIWTFIGEQVPTP